MGRTASVTPFRRLRALLVPESGDIGVIVVYGVGVGVLTLAVPIATQTLVNTAAFGTLTQPLLVLGLLVLAVLSAAGALRAMQVLVAERIQQRVFARLAIELSHRLPRTRYETYDTHRGTALVNRFMDVMTVQKNTTLLVLDGVAIVLQTFVGMVLLALYHPYLIGFNLLLLGAMAFVLFVLGRGAVKTAVRESYAKYDVLAWLEELARTPLAFRHAGATAWARTRADQATLSYLESRRAHFKILFRQTVGSLAVQAVASGVLLGLGGWLVANQQLSLGQLVAAELIVTPLVYRFARLGKYLEALYDLLAGADKIGSLFDLPLERTDGTVVHDAGPAHLRLRQVSYAHGGRVPVLDALELDVPPGDRVALIGGPGSGKSALADVLTGLRAPTSGAVELDGVDLRQRSSDVLRETVELVREPQLFDGTLEDNVRLGREDPRAVRELLDALGLLDELSSLPQGLATYVSGAHSPLHAGQALRLAVARALLGRPRLLVLDEVLDDLDRTARERVLELVLDPRAPWTLLLTTRRLDIARRCARVLRLGEGRLAEVAT
jgi:ABC-type bacteriocin/lantibiotic exporter with double-glycine peptidase domain